MLIIITSTSDELSGGINIDDLKRPWIPKIRVLVFLGRPDRQFGKVLYVLQQLFFVSSEIFEISRPIAAKFCHMVGSKLISIYTTCTNAGPKIWKPVPKKILGSKNMLNLARFWTSSHFEREYLRKGQRYPKSKNYLTDSNSSRVGQKSLANFNSLITEIWRRNCTPKIDFFGRPYFGP